MEIDFRFFVLDYVCRAFLQNMYFNLGLLIIVTKCDKYS